VGRPKKSDDELLKLKLAKLKALEEEAKQREMLPYLYGFKDYTWSEEFINEWSTKYQVLTAANQIGKSSSLWRKLIKMALSPERWATVWPDMVHTGQKPSQWWYLYPSKPVATIEFEEKVIPLLPKAPKNDPTYGWDCEYQYGHVTKLAFNSGINIYFKTYAQDVANLQAGSAYVVACDEEVPVDLLPELQMRISATNGYLFFVFTATLGQAFWRQVVEERSQWKDAKIWQVSLYDSMFYTDGTPSRWTKARIQQSIDRCTTKAEVQRRIYGRFVVDEGLKYPTFDRERHLKPWHRVPEDWPVYVGIDGGSGGLNHPAAIAFVAINPARTKGRVVKLWRGDGGDTTAQDIIKQFLDMSVGMPPVITVYYDQAAKDLGTIAERMGLPFMTAEKSHEIGESTLNTLFKTNSLVLYEASADSLAAGIPDDHVEGQKFAQEIESLLSKTNKRDAIDDAVDAVRYCITRLQWDWPNIVLEPQNSEPQVVLNGDELRMAQARDRIDESREPTLLEEMDFWDDLLHG